MTRRASALLGVIEMGCDIHLYVEYRTSADLPWQSADKWSGAYGDGPDVDFRDSFYHDRNYDLFAMLADVRNGSGFAGVDTGDGFVPIAMPKGLPEDLSPELNDLMVVRGMIEHTPSWLTVGELMAYDWTQTTIKRGWVNAIEWARHRDSGSPNSWSGGISGPSIKYVSVDEMERAWQQLRAERDYPEIRYASAHLREISGGNPDLERFDQIIGGRAHTQVSWQRFYYQQAKEFIGTVLPRLWRLGSAENVRIVFFFDN